MSGRQGTIVSSSPDNPKHRTKTSGLPRLGTFARISLITPKEVQRYLSKLPGWEKFASHMLRCWKPGSNPNTSKFLFPTKLCCKECREKIKEGNADFKRHKEEGLW